MQDFKPRELFVLQSEFAALQETLRQKDKQLAVAQRESAALQKQLREKDAQLQQAAPAADFLKLQNELKQERAEKVALTNEIQRLRQPAVPRSAPEPLSKIKLRSQPLVELAEDAVKKMLAEKGFFNVRLNEQGKGFPHQYEKIERVGQPLVIDHATGLTWQQSGSANFYNYADAEKYVRDLNAKKFAGYIDWRLPTLEEAMSLMEREKKSADLYIDSVFDKTQRWIWTADQKSAGVAWYVSFLAGYCRTYSVLPSHVRAVRAGQ